MLPCSKDSIHKIIDDALELVSVDANGADADAAPPPPSSSSSSRHLHLRRVPTTAVGKLNVLWSEHEYEMKQSMHTTINDTQGNPKQKQKEPRFNNQQQQQQQPTPHYYFGIRLDRTITTASTPPPATTDIRVETETETDPQWVGFCTFYLGYSTWNGRILCVDQLVVDAKTGANEEDVNAGTGTGTDDGGLSSSFSLFLYRVLAKIATSIGCERLVWKQNERPRLWNGNGCKIQPEFLEEWLFLSMDRPAMASFVGNTTTTTTTTINTTETTEQEPATNDTNDTTTNDSIHLHPPVVTAVVERILRTAHHPPDNDNDERVRATQLRLAGPGDTDAIARLVRQLAIYEREPDAVSVGANDYLRDGFRMQDGNENESENEPLFYCLLADVTTTATASATATATATTATATDANGEACPSTANNTATTTAAMAFFYFGHELANNNTSNTINGGLRFLYLEDLYCEPAFRNRGLGTLLMKQLARIALALGCQSWVWTALDWNVRALALYRRIGAVVDSEQKPTRCCGADLRSLAASVSAGAGAGAGNQHNNNNNDNHNDNHNHNHNDNHNHNHETPTDGNGE